MPTLLETLAVSLWNRLVRRRPSGGLAVGMEVQDGRVTKRCYHIADLKRPEHIVVLGKTGSGKSSLLRYFVQQDIERNFGFCFIDLHGDALPFVLATVAKRERELGIDLTNRLIIVEPGDPKYSVGLNVLEPDSNQQAFVQIAEISHILRSRWRLEALGVRTEELLRNSLLVLMENGLTLLETTRLVTDEAFRAQCVAKSSNSEVRQFFLERFNRASVAQRAVTNEAVLNKISEFSVDPRFRHIVGQAKSTLSLPNAVDSGSWIVVNLDKARLGEQAAVLGSLILAKVKNSIFARRKRSLLTLYCDELQNLVAVDSGIETLYAECRKFSVSLCSGNQWLEQYPASMRATAMAVGTHVLFQLASDDAIKMATALGGSKHLAERLRNLRQRHLIIKSGHSAWRELRVPDLRTPDVDSRDLYERCRKRWARRRTEIEQEILARQSAMTRKDGLEEWN